MSRDEDNQPPNYSKFGVLLFAMMSILILYFLVPILFPEKVPVDDPERDFNIIVRFIGINQQLLTNTNPFYYR